MSEWGRINAVLNPTADGEGDMMTRRETFWSGFALSLMTQNRRGITVFLTIDLLIPASIVGLTIALVFHAGMQWRDQNADEVASEDGATAELAQPGEALNVSEVEVEVAYAESSSVEGIADYWDREDLITLFFQERAVEAGVDRPWALRPVLATPKRAPALNVH